MIMLMLNHKVIIMAKDWVYRSPLFGMVVRYVGYIFSEDGTEENITNIKAKMNEGYSIMTFPQRSHLMAILIVFIKVHFILQRNLMPIFNR